jgi:sugar lactone lactonase YvrE
MPDREVELALDAQAELGEAPCWDAQARVLVWVDITPGIVHRFDPATGRDEALEVGQPVGAAVPTASGTIALAVSDGFAMLDLQTGRVDRIADVDVDVSGTMMNDGKCDPAGRFWAGTRDVDGRNPIGSLYRLDADHTVSRVLTGVTLSNGLGWSPDQRTMYYVDSTTYTIDAFDFEPSTSDLSGRRTLVDLPRSWGLPDGMAVDEEGCIWLAFWGASSLRRFAPDGGAVALIELPVSQVTSCAFGGDHMSDLYVTSARGGLSPDQLRDEPSAGGVFRLQPGVRGLPEHAFVDEQDVPNA